MENNLYVFYTQNIRNSKNLESVFKISNLVLINPSIDKAVCEIIGHKYNRYSFIVNCIKTS